MLNSQFSKFQICYFGWIYQISETKFSKNKIAYKVIRCCSYKNEWWNFIVFETTTDIYNLKIGDWVKITGFLKVNLSNSKIVTEIVSLEKLNKTEIKNDVPNIEDEIWGELEIE